MKNVNVKVRGVYWKTVSVDNHLGYISVDVSTPHDPVKDYYGPNSNSIDFDYSRVLFGIEKTQSSFNFGDSIGTSYFTNIEDEDIYIYDKNTLFRLENANINRSTHKPTYIKDIGVGSRFEILEL